MDYKRTKKHNKDHRIHIIIKHIDMFSLIQHRPLIKSIRQNRTSKVAIATLKKPFLHKSPRTLTIQRASGIDWEFSSYIVGKGVILFTLYYCTMNWWFYRRTREDDKKD